MHAHCTSLMQSVLLLLNSSDVIYVLLLLISSDVIYVLLLHSNLMQLLSSDAIPVRI